MKKNYFLSFLFSLLFVSSYAQTIIASPIYASAPAGAFITGNSTSSVRTDGDIVSTGSTQRGYAVFDLSSIPAGSIITNVQLGFSVTGYGGSGSPSGWNTRG